MPVPFFSHSVRGRCSVLLRRSFDPIGVVFVSLSLIADALIGNWQELMFSQFGASANEMMTYSNGWAALLSLFLCMVEGNNMAAIDFLLNDSMAVICIFVYCFLNILGIYFVLVMIAMFGATLTAFTTSLRKALSLVLSFLVYTKPFAWVSSTSQADPGARGKGRNITHHACMTAFLFSLPLLLRATCSAAS